MFIPVSAFFFDSYTTFVEPRAAFTWGLKVKIDVAPKDMDSLVVLLCFTLIGRVMTMVIWDLTPARASSKTDIYWSHQQVVQPKELSVWGFRVGNFLCWKAAQNSASDQCWMCLGAHNNNTYVDHWHSLTTLIQEVSVRSMFRMD